MAHRGRGNQAVSWISVKSLLPELTRSNGDVRRDWYESNSGTGEGLLRPYAYISVEFKLALRNLGRNLPTANRADSNCGCVVNRSQSLRRKEAWLTDPPDPDMGVEKNHCSASHSSSTGASTSDSRL